MKTIYSNLVIIFSFLALSFSSSYAQQATECDEIVDPLMNLDFNLLLDPYNCCQEIVGSYSDVHYNIEESTIEQNCGACDLQSNPYRLRAFVHPNGTWTGLIAFCDYYNLAQILNGILVVAGVPETFMDNEMGVWAEDVVSGFGYIDICVGNDCFSSINDPVNSQSFSSGNALPCTHNIIDPEYLTWDITQPCENLTAPDIDPNDLGENAPTPQNMVLYDIPGEEEDFTTNDIILSGGFNDTENNAPSANAIGNLFNAIASTGVLQNGSSCINLNCFDLSGLAGQLNDEPMAAQINDNLSGEPVPSGYSSWSQFLSDQAAIELENLNLSQLLNENFGMNLPNLPCDGEIISLPLTGGNDTSNNNQGDESGFQPNSFLNPGPGTPETNADPDFFGQTVPGLGLDGPGAATPSPEALSMIDNIKGGVNLYNGSQNTSIPLYTVNAKDVSIPISLSSSNNGIKVDDIGTLVGQNWNVDAGGLISRIVKGLPDEFEGTVYGIGRGKVYKLTPFLEFPSSIELMVDIPAAEAICMPSIMPKEKLKFGFKGKVYDKCKVKIFLSWTPLRGNRVECQLSVLLVSYPFLSCPYIVGVRLNFGFSIGLKPSEVLGNLEFEEEGKGFFSLKEQPFGLPQIDEASLEGLSNEEKTEVLNLVHPSKNYEDLKFFSDQIANWDMWIEAITGNHEYKTKKLDSQPDEFYFNVGGYSGKFSYNLDETPVIFPYQEGLTIVKHEDDDPIYPNSKRICGFTIKTPDGMEYSFGSEPGENFTAVDFTANTNYYLPNFYTYPEPKGSNGRDQFGKAEVDVGQISYYSLFGMPYIFTYGNTYDRNFKKMDAPTFSSAWHLVKVKSLLSQEEVDLIYDPPTSALTYYADKSFTHSFPNFGVGGNTNLTTIPNDQLNPLHFSGTKWENGRAEFAYSVTETSLYQWDLNRIETDRGESALFEYGTERAEIDGDFLLDKITIKRSGSDFKGWKFTYDTETAPGGGSSECFEDEDTGGFASIPGETKFNLGSIHQLTFHEFNNYLRFNFRVACFTLPFRDNLSFVALRNDKGYMHELSEFGSLMDVKLRLNEFNKLKEEAIYNAEHKRSFLIKIEEIDKNGGIVGEDVYTEEEALLNISYNEGVLPKRFSLNQDLMGYYNTNSTGSPLPPIKYDDVFPGVNIITPSINGVQKHFGFYNAHESGLFINTMHLGHDYITDFEKAKIGALESVKYATGGEIVYSYESNVFPFEGSEILGAGIRVATLKEDPFDMPAKTTYYSYVEPHVINDPIRIEQNPVDIYYISPINEQHVTCSSSPMNPMFSNKNNHVGYKQVIESWVNNNVPIGRVIHHFTTPIDFSEHIDGYSLNILENGKYLEHKTGMGNSAYYLDFQEGDDDFPPGLLFPEEMVHISDFLGLEYKTEVFNAFGDKVQQTDNTYQYYGTCCQQGGGPGSFHDESSSRSEDLLEPCYGGPGLTYFDSKRYQYNYQGNFWDNYKNGLIRNFQPYKYDEQDFGLVYILDDLLNFLLQLFFDAGMTLNHPYKYIDRNTYVSQRCINSGNVRILNSAVESFFEDGSTNLVTSNYSYAPLSSPYHLKGIPVSINTITNTNIEPPGETYTLAQNNFFAFGAGTGNYDQDAIDYLNDIAKYKVPLYSTTDQNGAIIQADYTALALQNVPGQPNTVRVISKSNYTARNGDIVLAGVFTEHDNEGTPKKYYLAKHGTVEGDPIGLTHFFDPIEFEWWPIHLNIKSRKYKDFITHYDFDATYFVLNSVTDPDDVQSNYFYDSRWRLEQALAFNEKQKTDYTYNIAEEDNWVKSILSFADESFPDQVTVQYSDGFGRAIRTVRDNDGATLSSTQYDNMFRVSRSYTIGKGMTSFTYNPSPLTRKTIAVDAEGNKTISLNTGDAAYFAKTEVTDPNEHTLTTFTDGFGRTRKRVSGAGGETLYDFNDLNQLIQITNPQNEYYNYTYNNIGRVATKEIPGAKPKSIFWDVAFRPVATKDGEGNGQVLEYDEYNRIITIKNKDGLSGDPHDAVGEGTINGDQLLLANSYVPFHTWLESTAETILTNGGFGGQKTTNYSNHDVNFGLPGNVQVIYPDGTFNSTITYNDAALTTSENNSFTSPTLGGHDYLLGYDYDDILRPRETKINFDQELQRINKLFYNDVDQVIKKYLGGPINGAPLQKVDYRYDAIGRLTHINSPSEMECFDITQVCDMSAILVIYPSRSVAPPSCQFLYSIKIDGVVHTLPAPVDLYNYPNDLQGAVQGALDALGYQGEVTVDVSQGIGGSIVIKLKISQTNAQEIVLEYGPCTPSITLNVSNCCDNESIPTDNPDGLPQDYTDLYYQYIEYTGLDINRIEIGSDCNTGFLRNDYTYDGDHRVTEMYNILFRPDPIPEAYNTTYGYTAAGNITNLTRKGFVGLDGMGVPQFAIIDNLAYTYDSPEPNQFSTLTKVVDNSSPPNQPKGFFPLTSDYSYDDNGNLINDSGKALTIEYNLLNLPTSVNSDQNADQVLFEYTFGGEKVKKYSNINGEEETRYYLWGFEFVDDGTTVEAEAFHLSDGRIDLSDNDVRFQFKIIDHLGNTVVFFEDKDENGTISTLIPQDPEDAEVVQRNLYYPFGLQLEGTWDALTEPRADYLYNGKELEEELRLNWHGYGARMYDPAIGRFPSVDPIADQFAWASPFNYAENEPVGHKDLWGLQEFKDLMGHLDPVYQMIVERDGLEAAESARKSFNRGFLTGAFAGGAVIILGALAAEATPGLYTWALLNPEVATTTGAGLIWGLGTDQDMPGTGADDLTRFGRNLVKNLTCKSQQITVIGEGMSRVSKFKDDLVEAGAENVNVFNPSKEAIKEWEKLTEGGKHLGDEVVKATKIFKENQTWIQKAKESGSIIIDIGSDGRKNASTFYEMEKQTVYD